MPRLSEERRGEYIKTVLKILKENNGSMASNEVLEKLGNRLNLSDYEKERYERSGYVRWWSITHFLSIGAVKAGLLRKNQSIWYLTDDGEKALSLSPKEIKRLIDKKYKEWKGTQEEESQEIIGESEESIVSKTAFEQALSLARAEVINYINKLDPYAFQDLVAALLRGMGYYTPFVAPRGKDGGFDILAYKDPIGSIGPRIKVQVKHRANQKVPAKDVRELISLLNKQDETGLIVSTAGFTSDSESEIRKAPKHIERIDLEEFINLWEEYYDSLKEQDKALLPLRRVHYLAPKE